MRIKDLLKIKDPAGKSAKPCGSSESNTTEIPKNTNLKKPSRLFPNGRNDMTRVTAAILVICLTAGSSQALQAGKITERPMIATASNIATPSIILPGRKGLHGSTVTGDLITGSEDAAWQTINDDSNVRADNKSVDTEEDTGNNPIKEIGKNGLLGPGLKLNKDSSDNKVNEPGTPKTDEIAVKGRYNLIDFFDEGEEDSVGKQLFDKLSSKESTWLSNAYKQVSETPEEAAEALGLGTEAYLGRYNATDITHDPNKPSTWKINRWSHINTVTKDENGERVRSSSNIPMILSMASIYSYYHDPYDIDAITKYAEELWEASHKKTASMGDVYYDNGCLTQSVIDKAEQKRKSGNGTSASNDSSKKTETNTESKTNSNSSTEDTAASKTPLGPAASITKPWEMPVGVSKARNDEENSKNEIKNIGPGAAAAEAQASRKLGIDTAHTEANRSQGLEFHQVKADVYADMDITHVTGIDMGAETQAQTCLQDAAYKQVEVQDVQTGLVFAQVQAQEQSVDQSWAQAQAIAAEQFQAMAQAQVQAMQGQYGVQQGTSGTDYQEQAQTQPQVWEETQAQVDTQDAVQEDTAQNAASDTADDMKLGPGAHMSLESQNTTYAYGGQDSGDSDESNGPSMSDGPAAWMTGKGQSNPDNNWTEANGIDSSNEDGYDEASGEWDEGGSYGVTGNNNSSDYNEEEEEYEDYDDYEAYESLGNSGYGYNSSYSSDKKVACPGHLDLTITVTINTLDGENSLFTLDTIGNDEANFNNEWHGWTEERMQEARELAELDWGREYGLFIKSVAFGSGTSTGTGKDKPLDDSEIEDYLNMLPDDISDQRYVLVETALRSVGRIPYYFGGKASVPGYDGNNFFTTVSPDYKGRSYKGLDCSGWIQWVYWTALGERINSYSTATLVSHGTGISRDELQPGDIIVRPTSGKSIGHVVMYFGRDSDGRMLCIHEHSSGGGNVEIQRYEPGGSCRNLISSM